MLRLTAPFAWNMNPNAEFGTRVYQFFVHAQCFFVLS
jgi:hypothetical protein